MELVKRFQKKIPYLPWVVCALGAIFYSYEYFLRISPNVMTGELMQHFHVNAATFGAMSAAYYYAYTPMQLPVGLMMDRYGPRRLLTLACFICVLGTYLFAVTNHFYLALLGRLLIGFGSAFAFVGVLKLAAIWLPPNKMAMFSGMASALGTLGGMFGEVTLTHLMIKVGWRGTLELSAVLGILLTVLLWLIISDQPKKSRKTPFKTHHQYIDFRKLIRDLIFILKNKQIWINGAVSCLIYLPTTVFAELWGIRYFQDARGFSAYEAAFAISTLYFGYTIGAPLMGMFSDRIKQRRLPIIIGNFGALVIFCLLLYVNDLPKTLIYLLLFSLGPFYSAHVVAFAIAREISPEKASGTAIAATNMLIMLGAALCQPLVGVLLDVRSQNLEGSVVAMYTAIDYQWALSIIPIGIAAALVLTFFLKETHAQPMKKERHYD